jgi:glyceraldehyde-3-phosphate dehydrogenase/erythrose-4-phosphate dehydrogenase
MTASQRTHATSDNSVPRSSRAGTENVIPQRDPRLRSIAQHINNRNGAVTVVEIASEADWTRDESGDHISRMQTANLVQLLDGLQEPVLLLTAEGEHFVQEVDL